MGDGGPIAPPMESATSQLLSLEPFPLDPTDSEGLQGLAGDTGVLLFPLPGLECGKGDDY